MKSIEFSYWLKGAFDLGQITDFNKDQTRDLTQYLKQIRLDSKDPLNEYVLWLKGFMEIEEPSILNKVQTRQIMIKLYDSLENINKNLAPYDTKYDQSVNPPGVLAKC